MERATETTHEPRKGGDGCTAPHPAQAFLLALPAFAIVIGAAFLVWALL